MDHIGIDYGARVAGTTAVCYLQADTLVVEQSRKKSDADKFIRNYIHEVQPSRVFIDAPLSIPAAFFRKEGSYSHRQCDKKLNAMSPMFLGGLTARAIELKDSYSDRGPGFFEVYPKALVKEIKINESYKKNISDFTDHLSSIFEEIRIPESDNWHQIDSILCWLSGYRYSKGKHIVVGDPNEGVIMF